MNMFSITNVRIYCAGGVVYNNGYIKVENTKIKEVGDMEDFVDFGEIIDKKNHIVIPGMIDAHTHIGISGDSLGFEGDDLNEMTNPLQAGLRAIDAVNPMDRCFKDAYNSGVTAVVTGPGSANPISGQMLLLKTKGKVIDDMIIKEPLAMKLAFGENPKSVYHSKNQAPETRMATASIIRESLQKAKLYAQNKQKSRENKEDMPEYNIQSESLEKLLRGEITAHIHAHRADDIMSALRISKEFNLKYTIVHCTEGHLIANELYGAGLKNAFVGPIISDRSKPELINLDIDNAKKLAKSGVRVSIITDHPEVPIEYLRLCAMLCVKNGLDKSSALDFITLNPATALGVQDRIGSIAKGKDADFVLLDGEPFDFYTSVREVYINGERIND